LPSRRGRGQYPNALLDQAGTVTEALGSLDGIEILMVSAHGHDATLHLAMEDATGDSVRGDGREGDRERKGCGRRKKGEGLEGLAIEGEGEERRGERGEKSVQSPAPACSTASRIAVSGPPVSRHQLSTACPIAWRCRARSLQSWSRLSWLARIHT